MIKVLVMDVDGTLTDGKIYISNQGEIMKAFCAKDGLGIHDILIPNGVIPVVLTGRTSDIVLNRCNELGIKNIIQGKTDKSTAITDFIRIGVDNIQIHANELAYIGDDLNDKKAMMYIKQRGGIIGCPKNAVKEIVDIASFVSQYDGGDGAVREFIEYIVELNNLRMVEEGNYNE